MKQEDYNHPHFVLKYTMSKTDVLSWRDIYKGLVETNSNVLFSADEEHTEVLMKIFNVTENHILVMEDKNSGKIYYRFLHSEEYVLTH